MKKKLLKMKSDSNTSKRKKLLSLKEIKDSFNKFSPKKEKKEVKLIKKNLKSPKASKKQILLNDIPKVIDLKEQYSLYKKELQTLKDEEEKIKELKDKLRLQTFNYNNTIGNTNKTNKEKSSNSTIKTKRRKIHGNFSPPPQLFKKNILTIIEKSNKSNKKHVNSYSNKKIKNKKEIIAQIKNRPKLNINLFSPNTNRIDSLPPAKNIKNKYNSPYKTIHTARNKKMKMLFDLDKKGDMNKKIGILTKAGMETEKKKKINQDNYFNYDLKNGYKFIGVCDGHGENGKKVSEFIKNNLPKELENEFNLLISNEKKRISILEGMLRHKDENNSEKKEKFNIEKYINYEKINELLKKVFISTNLKLFAENMKLNLKTSGSTCVSILYKKNSLKKLYTANLGDSRAIIIKNQLEDNNIWSYEQLSRDHKPSEKDEEERIIKYGGEIQKIQKEDGTYEGPLRIFKKGDEGPGLAMSRSFGDSDGETLGIIAEPEVKEYLIKKEDKALIIGTDGLWEYTTNEEVVDVIKKYWVKKDVNIIINELYKLSVENWKKEHCTIDDITIICVLLN